MNDSNVRLQLACDMLVKGKCSSEFMTIGNAMDIIECYKEKNWNKLIEDKSEAIAILCKAITYLCYESKQYSLTDFMELKNQYRNERERANVYYREYKKLKKLLKERGIENENL